MAKITFKGNPILTQGYLPTKKPFYLLIILILLLLENVIDIIL